MSIGKEVGTNGNGRNELRFYRWFKRLFSTYDHCKLNMPFTHRSAYAKFRCGMALLKIETGRYLGQPLDARICTFCPNHIKDEQHVMLHCAVYDSLRQNLFRKVIALCKGFC